MKIAKSTNSNVLVANAWHHRVDSLTSLVAVVTIEDPTFRPQLDRLTRWSFGFHLDYPGWLQNGYTAALELADSSKTVPLDVIDANTEAVRTALTRAVAHKTIKLGDFDINNVTIMSSGPNYSSSVTLKTYPTMDTKTATMISRFIENDLLARDPRLKYISVKCVDSGFLNQDQSLTNQNRLRVRCFLYLFFLFFVAFILCKIHIDHYYCFCQLRPDIYQKLATF